ncbi:MAG: Na+/H+ antiporter [Chloroflexi bacterium]|nr:Na+/H+ antiporter [Chloroflexota bacterium]
MGSLLGTHSGDAGTLALLAAIGAAGSAAASEPAAAAEHTLHMPEVVLLLSSLLLVAALAAVGLKRLRLPFTVGLVLLGVDLRLLSQLPQLDSVSSLKLSADVTIFVLVPALLFEASFNIDSRRLIENLRPILVLAVPVLLVSTGLVGVLLSIFGGMPLSVALVFGALISATDPVAVLAIFKEAGAPKRLSMLVDGESLFNDGTALVFFKLLLGLALAGAGGLEVVPGATIEFIRVFAGGAIVGVLAGWLFSLLIGRIGRESAVVVSLTLVLAYGTFAIADHVFHVSGVIATVAAGVTLGNFGRTKIAPVFLPQMEHFWELLGFIVNALIFLLVGLSVDLNQMSGHGPVLLMAIGAVLVARAIPMFVIMPALNRLFGDNISRTYQVVLFWGGLRGALALAMALSLPPEFPSRELVIDLTFGVVLFTLLIGGPTTGPLLRRLGLMQDSREEAMERQTAMALVAKEVEHKLDRLRGQGVVSQRIVDELAAQLHESQDEHRHTLDEVRTRERFTRADEERLLRRHTLLLEKRAATALFEDGEISEGTLKELHHRIQSELDALRWQWEAEAGVRAPRPSKSRRLSNALVASADRFLPLRAWARRRRSGDIERQYEMRRAHRLIVDTVLHELDEMGVAHVSDEAFQAVDALYRVEREVAEGALVEFAAQFPEYVVHAQRVIARRFYLKTEQETLAHLHEAGLIPERMMREAEEDIEAELAILRKRQFVDATREVELVKA